MSASVGRNDPCPCGSGLKYKQCCEGKLRFHLRGRRGLALGVLGLVIVAAVAWGLMRSQTQPTSPSRVTTPPPSTSADASTAPGGSAPGTTAPSTTAPGTSAAPNPLTLSPPPLATGAPTTAPSPTGAAPEAWTYDEKANRYFDPNHGHWHDGPPPPLEARGISATPRPPLGLSGVAGTAPPGPTPAPWTYDAVKNQHWNPEHGHWHSGPPPAVKP
jgi:SEC-C motif